MALEEASLGRRIEEAVHAAIGDALVQRNEGEQADDILVVDTEGNRLEVVSVEEGVIEVQSVTIHVPKQHWGQDLMEDGQDGNGDEDVAPE